MRTYVVSLDVDLSESKELIAFLRVALVMVQLVGCD